MVPESKRALSGATDKALKTHFKDGETRNNYSANVLQFPLHCSRDLLTLQEQCRAWRAVQSTSGNYLTPLPEDYIEGVRHG